ncbi:uncharacterized protein N7477_006852 [Penicillium maclennaniae]|uniref:uncharacterized protein n=1 Tax=Penicillium maclennaniae TaxID=1343394 RepID=UPI00253F7DE4|nr:uncharacterized protein N7477_006852 [Penicillium maclennaniae]KAJ5668282.1 hypothetical protein N7477_006852 [Penicillium maclennaniae]
MGRSIFTGKEVRAVYKHYTSTPGTGPRTSLHAVKFVKNACIPFVSAQVKKKLASLPKADNRATLSRYMNIFSADGALERLQVEYEAHPETLFFVGELVPCSSNAPDPQQKKWPNQISYELTQTALKILRRHENHETSFSAQEVRDLCTYQEQLSDRGADMWSSLAVFFRDAAHPLASPSLRAKYVAFSEEIDTTVIVNQYYDLVRDGAVSRLIQRISHLRHEKVEVKAGDVPPENPVSEYASEREQDCQHPGKQIRQTPENSKQPTQPISSAPEQAGSTGNSGSGIPLVGAVDSQGLALPSYTRAKSGKVMKKTFSQLSPRRIRDLIRQYDPADHETRTELRNNAEVFYLGGNYAYQLKPHYFWVMVQELEPDELAITEAQKDAIFPTWREALELSLVQRSLATQPANRGHSPNPRVSSVSTEYTDILQRMESKLDRLTDRVADFITENSTLKQSVDELTFRVNELKAIAIQHQDKTETKKIPGISKKLFRVGFPSEQKYGLSSDSGDVPSKFSNAPFQEMTAEVNNQAEETELPVKYSSRNKHRLFSEEDSVDEEIIQPLAKRSRRSSGNGEKRRRSTRAAPKKATR